MSSSGLVDLWRSLFRIGVGIYWLYFAATKWPINLGLAIYGINWVHPIMVTVSRVDPIPPVRQVMQQVVLPNWQFFATAQTVAETLVGVLLILGLATRPAALLATLLALGLSLTIAFSVSDVGVRWLYYLPVLASFEVFVSGAGSLALERGRVVPQWMRS
jgi:uncharacterized membrane protein YphA (DoxX/SURF4 family)